MGWGLPERRRRIYHVYVAPCFDRKIERERSVYGSNTVDLVLATNEMPKLLHPPPATSVLSISATTGEAETTLVPVDPAVVNSLAYALFDRRPGRVLDLFGEEVLQTR